MPLKAFRQAQRDKFEWNYKYDTTCLAPGKQSLFNKPDSSGSDPSSELANGGTAGSQKLLPIISKKN